MRVMYVIPSLERGGAETLLVGQIPYLIKAGIEPMIVTTTDRIAMLEESRLTVRHVSLNLAPACGTAGALVRSMRLATRLRQVIKACRPDLVHLHLFKSDAWGRLAARGLAQTVTTWHSTDRWMTSGAFKDKVRLRLERWTAQADGTHFVAVSRGVRDWCCRHIKVPQSRVELIYNGTDLSKAVADFPVRNNAPARIIMVGRFYRAKGHDIALKALARVRDTGLDFRADFLGEGPLLEATQRLATELDLKDVVRFPGVSRVVPSILPKYDIFLMPSRYEGLGIAALEAMASYVPAVVTRVSGLEEVFKHEKNGLMAPPEDPEALAAMLIRMIRDEDLRRRLALAARRTVEERFNLESQVRKMVEYYRRISR